MGFFSDELGIIAYRGASAYKKPGSKEAFKKALELGVNGVYAELGIVNNELIVEPEGCKLSIFDFLEFIRRNVKVILSLSRIPTKEAMSSYELIKDGIKEINEVSRLVLASVDTALLSNIKSTLGIKVAAFINNPFPNIGSLRKLGIDFIITPHSLVRARVVKEAKGRGIEVIAWLVNDPTVLLRMESMGVSAVITERPDILREARKIG